MILDDDLYQAYLRAGACEATAKEVASEHGFQMRRRIEREKRHLDIIDLLGRTQLSLAGIANRVGCHKETVRQVKLKSVA